MSSDDSEIVLINVEPDDSENDDTNPTDTDSQRGYSDSEDDSDTEEEFLDFVPPKCRKIKHEETTEPVTDILNTTSNDEEVCSVCLEPWTLMGDHKLVSIKCGHFFGRKCIEKWLKANASSSKCPLCQLKCNKNDIRNHFLNLRAIKMIDNTEFIECQEKLQKAEQHIKKYETDVSHLKLNNSMLSMENEKLKTENKLYKETHDQISYQNSKIGLSSNSSKTKDNIQFQLCAKHVISNKGNCRVMSYSSLLNGIVVSCPTGNALFTGYGVKFVYLPSNKIVKNVRLHDQAIRDLSFSPDSSSNLLLSGSLDKNVKLSCINSNSIVCTWTCEQPVWSVCWTNNPHIFYAGLGNGSVCELDSRKPSHPRKTIWEQSGGPIHSLNYSADEKYTLKPGIIVSNAAGTLFVPTKVFQTETDLQDIDTNHVPTTSTLKLSCKYNSSISHSLFNPSTGHLLSTLRGCSGENTGLRFVVSEIGENKAVDDNIYSLDVKSYLGGKSTKFMSRSCFLNQNNKDLLVLCPDEQSASVNLYNLKSPIPIYKFYHRDLSVKKPILDVCQIRSNTCDSLMFGALNSDNLYLLKEKSVDS